MMNEERFVSFIEMVKKFNEECCGECGCCIHHLPDHSERNTHCLILNSLKSVDAVEVVHGRWLVDDLGHTSCSRCHERLPFIHCYCEDVYGGYDDEWDEEMPESLFCPNCGAKMDAKDIDVPTKDGGAEDG